MRYLSRRAGEIIQTEGSIRLWAFKASEWKSNQMGREMLKQRRQEVDTQKQIPPSYSPKCILGPVHSDNQSFTIPAKMLHPNITLPTLLGQGGSERLHNPHVTMCLAMLQAEIIKKICANLLLTSAPTWQGGQLIITELQSCLYSPQSPLLKPSGRWDMRSGLPGSEYVAPGLPSQSPCRSTRSQYPQAAQNSLGNTFPTQTSITLSTQISSSWPSWHPPTCFLERCHMCCKAMARAVLFHLRRRARNPLSPRKKAGKRKHALSGGRVI